MQQRVQQVDGGADRRFQAVDPFLDLVEVPVPDGGVDPRPAAALAGAPHPRCTTAIGVECRVRAQLLADLVRDRLHVARAERVLLGEVGREQQRDCTAC